MAPGATLLRLALLVGALAAAADESPPSPLYDCNLGFTAVWSPARRHWCCQEAGVGCAKAASSNTSSNATSSCSGYDAPMADMDLAGPLLKNITGSKDACCALCDSEPGCEGWVWLQGVCYLKAQAVGTYPSKGCVTRRKSRPPSPSGGCSGYDAPRADADLAGTLLKSVTGREGECCALCDSEPGCEGWAWTQNVCYLKADVTGTYHAEGCMSRMKSRSPPQSSNCSGYDTPVADTDLAGTLVKKLTAGKGECCALCDSEPGCEGWSWTQNVCYLKADVTGTYRAEGCVTRMKAVLGTCAGYTYAKPDKDLKGDMLGDRHYARSEGACCSRCTASAACGGSVYVDADHSCYLKANVTGYWNHTGLSARIKQ